MTRVIEAIKILRNADGGNEYPLYRQIEWFMNKNMDDIREVLADIEHQQWAHWTRYMIDNLTPENISRWRRQVETHYKDLTEEEKNSDRVWANKVITALQDNEYIK